MASQGAIHLVIAAGSLQLRSGDGAVAAQPDPGDDRITAAAGRFADDAPQMLLDFLLHLLPVPNERVAAAPDAVAAAPDAVAAAPDAVAAAEQPLSTRLSGEAERIAGARALGVHARIRFGWAAPSGRAAARARVPVPEAAPVSAPA